MRLELEIGEGAIKVVGAPPSMISQHTSEQHIGLRRGSYLRTLPRFEAWGGTVHRVGKTRMVDLAEYRRWLHDLASCELDQADDVDVLAQELGLQRAG